MVALNELSIQCLKPESRDLLTTPPATLVESWLLMGMWVNSPQQLSTWTGAEKANRNWHNWNQASPYDAKYIQFCRKGEESRETQAWWYYSKIRDFRMSLCLIQHTQTQINAETILGAEVWLKGLAQEIHEFRFDFQHCQFFTPINNFRQLKMRLCSKALVQCMREPGLDQCVHKLAYRLPNSLKQIQT